MCVRSQRIDRVAPVVSVVARAIATAGGAGYAPVAPGTCGSLVTLPLAWALAGLPLGAYLGVVAGVIVVGAWAAGVADRVWGTHDSGRIVIDEVAGMLLTLAFVDRRAWPALAIGFVLFRVADIWKPWPARAIDRGFPGGLGVVLDDVVAGAYAAIATWAAVRALS